MLSSWGTGWGMDGYFNIEFEEGGIGNDVVGGIPKLQSDNSKNNNKKKPDAKSKEKNKNNKKKPSPKNLNADPIKTATSTQKEVIKSLKKNPGEIGLTVFKSGHPKSIRINGENVKKTNENSKIDGSILNIQNSKSRAKKTGDLKKKTDGSLKSETRKKPKKLKGGKKNQKKQLKSSGMKSQLRSLRLKASNQDDPQDLVRFFLNRPDPEDTRSMAKRAVLKHKLKNTDVESLVDVLAEVASNTDDSS